MKQTIYLFATALFTLGSIAAPKNGGTVQFIMPRYAIAIVTIQH